MIIRQILASFALLGVMSTPSFAAALMQLNVSGTVNSTFGGFPAPVTVEASYVFDLDDLFGSFGTQSNFAWVSSTVTLNGSLFAGSSGQFVFQDQVPTSPASDRLTASALYNVGFGGVFIKNVALNLQGPESVFAFGDIPFLPDPADFTTLQILSITFSGGTCPSNCVVSTEPTSVVFSMVGDEAAVPAPAGYVLLLGGLALLRIRRTTHSARS